MYPSAGGSSRPAGRCVRTRSCSTGATARSTLEGTTEQLAADTLVIAETPVAETALATELTGLGIAFHQIGDAVAPRRASLAIYEGRDLALRL